ncbi:MAG TPA: glycosyl hydrolase family 8 [Chloroflexota bacterium]|nr:glycosyl hydrolase family 8 [Chloroflexota bacterium]
MGRLWLPGQAPVTAGTFSQSADRLWRDVQVRALAEPLLVVGLLLVALVAHGLNMFQYPALNRFDDEGVYLSQAWAIIREHRLAPYSYFYDHAPAGWILLAGWMAITGGPHAFGLAVNSGRTFMLLLHLAMVPLLYRLARRLGCAPWAAALAVLLFTVSPLAIYFQRPVLLDSIANFWLLVSVDLLLDDWGRLTRLILSGCCFGVAVLSKESAAFLLPAYVFLAVQQRQQHHGRFAVVSWAMPMLLVVSLYPTFAALRGELLPAGQSLRFFIFNVNTGPGLSLVDALRWQASRTGGGVFNLNNQFWTLVRTNWLVADPVLFGGGAMASIVNLLRGRHNRAALGAGLLGVLPLLYLARGGMVFDFYVLLAIPFFCLNLGLLLTDAVRFAATWASRPFMPAGRRRMAAAAGWVVLPLSLLALLGVYSRGTTFAPLYTQHPGEASLEALQWVKQHVPAQSLIVVGDDIWTDLHEPGLGGPAFPNAHSYWKVGLDPAIANGVFHNTWHTVDYLILSPQMKADIASNHIAIAQQALQHAQLVQAWHAGGGDVELWKVEKPGATEQQMLKGSNAYMNQHFGRQGAYVAAAGDVTSESQGYGLLRDAWLGDRSSFAQTWSWTRAHLMNQQGLLGWEWRDGALADAHSASDADTDVALALLMAGKAWNNSAYLAAGAAMVSSIWKGDVVTVGGKPYLAGGNWAQKDAVVGINPSYFAPYAYRVFALVDPAHPWTQLVDSSYQVLFAASSAPLGGSKAAGLPPDWVGLNRATGQLQAFNDGKGDLTQYGYDGARAYWRIALDLRWFNDGRARAYLQQAGFLREEVQRSGAPAAVYKHDGQPVQHGASVVGDVGALSALLTLDPTQANRLYASQLLAAASGTPGATYWASGSDLYAQEWGWFGTALYAHALPNLWADPSAAAGQPSS